MLKVGTVVKSLAGRDKDKLLSVVGESGNHILVCDGKERPLERPKQKNTRHLKPTGAVLEPAELETNRALRKALRRLNAEISGNN